MAVNFFTIPKLSRRKRASIEFRYPSLPGVPKLKTKSSAGKLILIVFWDVEDLLFGISAEGQSYDSDLCCKIIQKLKMSDKSKLYHFPPVS